jgi:hypothetical protein
MTRPTIVALALALTGLGLAGCETAEGLFGAGAEQRLIAAGKTPMSGAEIQRLWASGATIRDTGPWSETQRSWASRTSVGGTGAWSERTIRHFPDGSATMEWTTGYTTGSDKGTWRVEGNQSCKTWQAVGHERCWTIYKTGDNEYQSFRDGRLRTTWSVIK